MKVLDVKFKAIAEENDAAKQMIDDFKASNQAAASDAAAAAAAEHDALLKAKADLETLQSEVDALNAAHAAALKEATDKIAELRQTTKWDVIQNMGNYNRRQKLRDLEGKTKCMLFRCISLFAF